MFKHLMPVCILTLLTEVHSSNGSPVTNEVTGDQELLFAIAVNRHGERSPDAEELSLSHQQDKISNLTRIEGPEGLTNMGKRKAYQLGKFYRHRYGAEEHGLVSNLYSQNEIYIRSTDKERSKMTIQVAMAALYPPEPEQQWDDSLGKIWQPVPYTTVPLSEDYLRYFSNCDKYITHMDKAKKDSFKEEFRPYLDLIPLLKEKTGRDFTENPLLFQSLIDLYRSTVNLGLEIPEWAKPILPRLKEAARLAYRLYFRNEEMTRIGGGVLLDIFIKAADDIVAGKVVSQRLRLFSAHDFNLGSLMEAAKAEGANGIPDYGSVFALELYRSKSSGEFSVLPVYLATAGDAAPKLLRITGCGNTSNAYCNYTKFRELVKKNILPEDEYYKMCNVRTEL